MEKEKLKKRKQRQRKRKKVGWFNGVGVTGRKNRGIEVKRRKHMGVKGGISYCVSAGQNTHTH